MNKWFALFVLSFLLLWCPVRGTIRNVPSQNYPTIQAGIDSAMTGDTVLIAPGIYNENDSLRGREIVLGSFFVTTHDDSYIGSTIIDGGARGTVLTIHRGEGVSTIVEGLTIRNGLSASRAGGIQINNPNTSPVIRNNRIMDNTSSSYNGGGIACINQVNPTICYNFIAYNRSETWNGGGISCEHCSANIHNNLIISNHAKL